MENFFSKIAIKYGAFSRKSLLVSVPNGLRASSHSCGALEL